MTKLQQVGRLAFRVEGEWWVAYWAPSQHNMDEAQRLGMIKMSVVGPPGSPVNAGFMALMRAAFDNVAADVFGGKPVWGEPHRAPEAERAGRA